jgi:hypothetical protein
MRVIKKHKDIIEEKIDHFHSNKKVLAFYKWVSSYHNYFCKTFLHKCPKRFLTKYRYHHKFKRIQ